MYQVTKRSSEEIRLMYVFEQAVEHIESKKKRVMGMNEPMDLKEAYERIAKNQSNSSLYHLAGDSIVVDVLMAIFKELLRGD